MGQALCELTVKQELFSGPRNTLCPMFNFFHLSGIWPLLPFKPLPHIVCARSHIRWSLSLFLSSLSSPLSRPISLSLPLFSSPSLRLATLTSSTLFALSLLSLADSAARMDGWRAGRGRGLPRNVTGLFLFRLHSLPSLQAPATWECHMLIRQWGWLRSVAQICNTPGVSHHHRVGELRVGGAGTLRSWDLPVSIALCLIPRKTSLILQGNNCRNWDP